MTAPARPSTTFPPTRGKDLEGNEVSIPRDLHKPYNLLLVAFQQWHQGMINGWVNFLQEMKATRQAFDFYEIPTLNALWSIARGFIDGGMRGGIPSKATRLHTVTLYINKEPFKRALGIDTEDTIYLFLVGRDGTIHWTGTGDFDMQKGKSLDEVMERLEGLTGPA